SSPGSAKVRKIRGRELALVLQSPAAALNPMLRISTQLWEAWRAHEGTQNGDKPISEALAAVNLPADRSFLKSYPNQISTGQGQRVLIAMAILHQPALIIADEPTSSLDAITQVEILQLLKRCNPEVGHCYIADFARSRGARISVRSSSSLARRPHRRVCS